MPVETFRPTSLLRYAAALAGLLSRPTACRSTPIRTTALSFMVRVDPEGAVSVRLVAWAREQGNDDIRPGHAASSGADLYLPTHKA